MFGKPLGALAHDPSVQGYLSSRNVLLQLLSTMSVAPAYLRRAFIPLALLSAKLWLGFAAFRDLLKSTADAVVTRGEASEKGGKGRLDMMDKLYKIVKEKGQKLDFGPNDVVVEVAGVL